MTAGRILVQPILDLSGVHKSRSLVRKLFRRYLPPLTVVAALVVIWYLAVSIFGIPFYIVPTPRQVVTALLDRGWGYLPDIWITSQEILAGFALGLLAALPLAGLISRWQTMRQSLYPVLISSQLIPIFAIAAVVTIVFQYGLLPQIVVTALYSFFPIVVNGADGLSRVDPELVGLLRAADASEWRIFRTVRIPSALPALFSASKLALIFAVSGATMGEWIGGQAGLGYFMRYENSQFNMPGVFAAVVVLSLLGALLFSAVALMERVALPWHRDARMGLGDLWRAAS